MGGGNENAYRAIKKSGAFIISVITDMEFIQGMRSKQKPVELRKTLNAWNTKIIYF